MLDYLNKTQRKLKVGISSYSENSTSLKVTGKVGIGTDDAKMALDVNGGVGAAIHGYANVIMNNVQISPPYRTAVTYLDEDLTLDIEPGVEVTIDPGCFLNVIDLN